jgi:hypothetical protein
MQHGCSMDIQHGLAAFTCGMGMQVISKKGSWDIRCSIDMACSPDVQRGNAAGACSMEINNG